MTRTFLKKKCFRSETEVKIDSGSAKGDSATNSIHPATNYLPQKCKTNGIRDCSQTHVYTRKSQRKPRVYVTVNQKPMYMKKRCIKTRQTDMLRQTLLQSDSTRHTCPQTQHKNKREREIQIH